MRRQIEPAANPGGYVVCVEVLGGEVSRAHLGGVDSETLGAALNASMAGELAERYGECSTAIYSGDTGQHVRTLVTTCVS